MDNRVVSRTGSFTCATSVWAAFSGACAATGEGRRHPPQVSEGGAAGSTERRGTRVCYRVEPSVHAAMGRMLTAAAG